MRAKLTNLLGTSRTNLKYLSLQSAVTLSVSFIGYLMIKALDKYIEDTFEENYSLAGDKNFNDYLKCNNGFLPSKSKNNTINYL